MWMCFIWELSNDIAIQEIAEYNFETNFAYNKCNVANAITLA